MIGILKLIGYLFFFGWFVYILVSLGKTWMMWIASESAEEEEYIVHKHLFNDAKNFIYWAGALIFYFIVASYIIPYNPTIFAIKSTIPKQVFDDTKKKIENFTPDRSTYQDRLERTRKDFRENKILVPQGE